MQELGELGLLFVFASSPLASRLSPPASPATAVAARATPRPSYGAGDRDPSAFTTNPLDQSVHPGTPWQYGASSLFMAFSTLVAVASVRKKRRHVPQYAHPSDRQYVLPLLLQEFGQKPTRFRRVGADGPSPSAAAEFDASCHLRLHDNATFGKVNLDKQSRVDENVKG
jgi:hypothetical protein